MFALSLFLCEDIAQIHKETGGYQVTAGISSNIPLISISNKSASADFASTEESTGFFTEIFSDEAGFDASIPFNGYTGISYVRQTFVNVATSFEGLIPYSWGSKMSTSPDYSPTKNGLDCSGFVQYVYYFITDSYNENLGSTYKISSSCSQIQADQLKPGDLGVIRIDGSYYTAPESTEKYYDLNDALAYIEKYNEHLREISWEEEEVEEIVYEKVLVEVTDEDEDEDDEEASEDDKNEEDSPASENTKTSEESNENNSELNAASGNEVDEEAEDTKKEKKYVEKTVAKKVIKTELVSTLNEEDLLTEDDLTLVSNHVGIYVGTDENGNQLWCHCAGQSYGNTVVVGQYEGFKYFFRIID